jgi:PIN domain nuclease of toxin-antitoxin system
MSDRYLLDASAVLALIGDEPGADRVLPLLARSAITAINLAEVVKKLRERGVPLEEVAASVSDLQIPLQGVPADVQQAVQLGQLAATGRAFGLSLGDAVCLGGRVVRTDCCDSRAAMGRSGPGRENTYHPLEPRRSSVSAGRRFLDARRARFQGPVPGRLATGCRLTICPT